MSEQDRKIYEDWYRPFWPKRTESYFQCFYCGDPADTMDHQPPISRINGYRQLGLMHEFYVKVPCCRECNSLLGNTLTEDLIERDLLAKEKITKKYKRDLALPLWDENEVNELGRNLREGIKNTRLRKEWIEERLDYSGGINSWLEETEFHEEKRSGEL